MRVKLLTNSGFEILLANLLQTGQEAEKRKNPEGVELSVD